MVANSFADIGILYTCYFVIEHIVLGVDAVHGLVLVS